MSHFTVLVIGDNPETQLAPYDENTEVAPYQEPCWCQSDSGAKFYHEHPDSKCDDCLGNGVATSTYNPQSKWDWFLIGGRWTGYFKLKDKKIGKVGDPGIMTKEAKDGWCDQARKADINFEAMIVQRRENAIATYRKAEPAIEKFASAMTPEARKNARGNLYWDAGIKTIGEADSTDERVESLDEYVARHTTLSTFAVVKDGQWYEKGKMGWWAAVSDEKDDNRWESEFRHLLESVEDSTLLTLVDCHI